MKKAFSLVEIMIVVAILGIIAAIIIPELQGHALQAKEAAAKDTLRAVRTAIESFAAQHNDRPPGYAAGGAGPPASAAFYTELLDGYLGGLPKNPFNGLATIKMINDADPMPDSATGQFGWVYKPLTKDFRLDWPGNDSAGVRYYDY